MGFDGVRAFTQQQMQACGEAAGPNAKVLKQDGSAAGTAGELRAKMGTSEFQHAIETGALKYDPVFGTADADQAKAVADCWASGS